MPHRFFHQPAQRDGAGGAFELVVQFRHRHAQRLGQGQALRRVGDEVADPQSVVDSQPQAMPEAFGERLEQRSAWLNWERALLDFHSGRLFGRAGVWLVDIAGVLLCILALSGVTLWWLHRKRSD